MKRQQFTFYRSYFEAVSILPKKEQTAVLMAVCDYALNKEMPTKLSGTANAIFMLIKPTLDTGWKKAIGGSKESTSKDADKTTARQAEDSDKTTARQAEDSDKTTARQAEDSGKEKKGEKEVEVEVEVENECYPPTPLPKGARAPRFSPPSVEDVRAYCLERGNHVDPERFVDFYASKGWMVGKSRMKDWEAAVRTWEKNADDGHKDGFETSNPFLEMLNERRGMS